LSILQSKDKIPYVSYRGGEVHNFWQDADHVRGIWRKSTLPSYLSDSPVWETVLDIDALAKSEDKNWVYKGLDCLAPNYERCIINLSDGGKDAVVRREFKPNDKTFIENGFVTEESKGGMSWLSETAMVVGVDFGEGSMTDSGYPMIAKLWQRDSALTSAVEFGRGEKADVGYWASVWELSDGRREIIAREFKLSDYIARKIIIRLIKLD
jgi:prolyl oligopeptidase